ACLSEEQRIGRIDLFDLRPWPRRLPISRRRDDQAVDVLDVPACQSSRHAPRAVRLDARRVHGIRMLCYGTRSVPTTCGGAHELVCQPIEQLGMRWRLAP